MFRPRSIAWLLPFGACASGYLLSHLFFSVPSVSVPNLIGSSLENALSQLAPLHLSVRQIGIKQEPQLPHNTIVRQLPTPGSWIKPHQPILIVIAQQPVAPVAPSYIGLPLAAAIERAQASEQHVQYFHLPSTAPSGHCFAQLPAAGSPLTSSLMLYIAAPQEAPIIWPDFCGMPLHIVSDFLSELGIQAHIYPSTTENKSAPPIITQQYPAAYSIIQCTAHHLPLVQLQVKNEK